MRFLLDYEEAYATSLEDFYKMQIKITKHYKSAYWIVFYFACLLKCMWFFNKFLLFYEWVQSLCQDLDIIIEFGDSLSSPYKGPPLVSVLWVPLIQVVSNSLTQSARCWLQSFNRPNDFRVFRSALMITLLLTSCISTCCSIPFSTKNVTRCWVYLDLSL